MIYTCVYKLIKHHLKHDVENNKLNPFWAQYKGLFSHEIARIHGCYKSFCGILFAKICQLILTNKHTNDSDVYVLYDLLTNLLTPS